MSHSSRHDEEGVIDLRSSKDQDDEPEFRIKRVAPPDPDFSEHPHGPAGSIPTTPVSPHDREVLHAQDKVRVKFDKFVNLIATHAYQEIFDSHLDEDVIISTDLLADLANAHEEKDDTKKVPMFFLVGIVLGVIVTWIILKSNT